MTITGLVLAAGAGTRFGSPKGLARDAEGTPWVESAARTLRTGGCDRVLVAVGARADEVAALVPAGVEVVRVDDWAEGLSATLRRGLLAASAEPDGDLPGVLESPRAVVVTTVDTPDLPVAAVERIVARAQADGPLDDALAQAVYSGRPGHPVLIGAARIAAVCASLRGDRGARLFLTAHGVREIECGDLWSGADIDTR